MSLDTYEAMLETAATDDAISEAEAELAKGGQLHDAAQALESLRRKHFGRSNSELDKVRQKIERGKEAARDGKVYTSDEARRLLSEQ